LADEIYQEANETNEDSPVIKALRAQIKDLKKDLDTRPVRDEVELEIRTQLKRESDVAAQLIAQGQPAGLAEFALTKIGDADVTAEAVSAFLQGIGVAANPVSADADPQPTQSQQLADVSTLAGKVAAASSGATAESVAERLGQTQSMAEVEAIMAEIGAVQSEI
jgi:hypothetical protein